MKFDLSVSLLFCLSFSFLAFAEGPAPKRISVAKKVVQKHQKKDNKRPWTWWALKLSGESQKVRRYAIKRLRQRPKLKKELRKAIKGKQRALALDVISALRMRSFFPLLIQLSNDDLSGQSLLTLNILANDPKRISQLTEHYFNLLLNGSSEVSLNKIIALETLGRLGRRLPEDLLISLLEEKNPELGMAVLNYVKFKSIREKKSLRVLPDTRGLFENVLSRALKSEVFHIRLKTYFLIGDLKIASLKNRILCGQESHEATQKVCRKIARTL